MFDRKTCVLGSGKLEYVISGQGRPVIVLLSGYGVDIDVSWNKVWLKAKAISTVFAYNRFGYGGSDRVKEVQSGSVVIATLRDLLKMKNLEPPYVLVGHSLGGLYANLFARQYPQEVSGMVLIDATYPDQQSTMSGEQSLASRVIVGVLKAIDRALNARHSELTSEEETALQMKRAGPFPNIPLRVITAGRKPSSWIFSEKEFQIHMTNQRSLSVMSPQGRQIVAEKAGHFVQIEEPELVVRTIAEVVAQSREQ